jgi:hypothetical protein
MYDVRTMQVECPARYNGSRSCCGRARSWAGPYHRCLRQCGTATNEPPAAGAPDSSKRWLDRSPVRYGTSNPPELAVQS